MSIVADPSKYKICNDCMIAAMLKIKESEVKKLTKSINEIRIKLDQTELLAMKYAKELAFIKNNDPKWR